MRAAVGIISALVVMVALSGCSHPKNQQVPGGSADLGKVAIQHYGCGACHAIPGIRSAIGNVGPTLAGIADRRMIAGIVPNTPG